MDNNTVNTVKKRYNDEKTGRFTAGNPGRPRGSKNYLSLLEDALKREAEKAGRTFWEKLAEWAFKNPHIAISILKKFIPDKAHMEHEVTEPIEILIKHAGKLDEKEGS